MLYLLTIASLFLADQAPSINKKLGAELAKKISIQKINQNCDFTLQKEIFSSSMGIDSEDIEGLQEIDIVEGLDQEKLDFQLSGILEGDIQIQIAKILKGEKIEQEILYEVKPVLENLTQVITDSVEASPSEAPESNLYETLSISMDEKQKIGKILITMAENSVFKLLFEKKRLERLGHDIRNVHPIRFLGTVFSDPRLVHCMHRIRSSGFKWDGFINGFSERFMEELLSNNVNQYIPGLSESLGLKTQDLQYYVDRKDFEGLIIFMMERKRH